MAAEAPEDEEGPDNFTVPRTLEVHGMRAFRWFGDSEHEETFRAALFRDSVSLHIFLMTCFATGIMFGIVDTAEKPLIFLLINMVFIAGRLWLHWQEDHLASSRIGAGFFLSLVVAVFPLSQWLADRSTYKEMLKAPGVPAAIAMQDLVAGVVLGTLGLSHLLKVALIPYCTAILIGTYTIRLQLPLAESLMYATSYLVGAAIAHVHELGRRTQYELMYALVTEKQRLKAKSRRLNFVLQEYVRNSFVEGVHRGIEKHRARERHRHAHGYVELNETPRDSSSSVGFSSRRCTIS